MFEPKHTHARSSTEGVKSGNGIYLADNRGQNVPVQMQVRSHMLRGEKTAHQHTVVQQKNSSASEEQNRVAQLKLDYTGTFSSAPEPTVKDHFDASEKPTTKAVERANIYVTQVGDTTDPADLDGMSGWLNYLKDPSKGDKQTLTRMHAIRGKFGGPSEPKNMFLGTAFSNNFNSGSHYSQVEKPIQDFLTKEPGRLGVDYTVIPDYSTQPSYITKRYATIADRTERANFQAWAQNALPARFSCYANFHKTDAHGTPVVKQTVETLPADIGATATPTTTVVAGGLAGAAATGLGVAAVGTAAVLAAPVTAAVLGIGAIAGAATGAYRLIGGYHLRRRPSDH